jgi:hypothetical protein
MVFGVVFGGALAGMGLQRVLPESQLGEEAKDIIRLATGLLVTMTALVLGMLVSTANSSYQDRKNELAEMSSNFVLVDGLLGSYGPETQGIRMELRGLAESGLERIWPSHATQVSQLRPTDNGQSFYDRLQILAPIFTSFGLFAPHTKTIVVTLVACALAVSCAVFIIMAMYTPFSGVMRISSSPIREALNLMGH